MKKILVTSLLSLTAALAFGQGTVWFDNAPTTLSSPPNRQVTFRDATTPGNVFGTAGAPAVGTNFYASLYYKVGTVTDDSLLALATKSQSKLRASTTTVPGTWSGVAYATLDGVPFGAGAVTLQVRVWDSVAGATYDASLANNGVTGKSALFSYAMPGSASDPAASFFMANFNGFTIQAVPEPSTFALAGLGAAAMLIFRRRK